MIKLCTKCKRLLTAANFYKIKGKYTSQCKDCRKAANTVWRKANLLKQIEHVQKYRRTQKGKKMLSRQRKGYINRYPDKVRARSMVAASLRTGKLIKGNCEVCADPRTEAHHDDYSKPLAVRWLCSTHHKEADIALIEGRT